MKRYIAFLLAPLVFAMTSLVMAQDVDKLIVLTEEYPPYNYMDKDKVCGTATEIVVDVLERLGSKLTRKDIRLIPWARAYHEVLTSKDAILYSTTRTADREQTFKWVCPVGFNIVGVIARKRDRVVIKEPEDFERYRIGVVREDIGHQLMRKLIPEKDLDIVNSSESNLRKLQEGRIDMFVYDVQVAGFVLTRLGLDADKFETIYVLEKSPLCIAFNKDVDDAFVQKFQNALDIILKERPPNESP